MKRAAWLFLLGAGLAACGGSSSGSSPVVTISGMAFSPTVLSAAPSAIVTVRNMDAVAHSFTSESAQGAFDGPATVGAVSFDVAFDTAPFPGERTFTIPAGAVIGTSVWFYCKNHLGAMNQGYIQIVAPGSGGGY